MHEHWKVFVFFFFVSLFLHKELAFIFSLLFFFALCKASYNPRRLFWKLNKKIIIWQRAKSHHFLKDPFIFPILYYKLKSRLHFKNEIVTLGIKYRLVGQRRNARIVWVPSTGGNIDFERGVCLDPTVWLLSAYQHSKSCKYLVSIGISKYKSNESAISIRYFPGNSRENDLKRIIGWEQYIAT